MCGSGSEDEERSSVLSCRNLAGEEGGQGLLEPQVRVKGFMKGENWGLSNLSQPRLDRRRKGAFGSIIPPEVKVPSHYHPTEWAGPGTVGFKGEWGRRKGRLGDHLQPTTTITFSLLLTLDSPGKISLCRSTSHSVPNLSLRIKRYSTPGQPPSSLSLTPNANQNLSPENTGASGGTSFQPLD